MPFKSSARGAYGPQGQKVIKGPLAPVWVTGAGSVGSANLGASVSVQLSATDDSGDAPTYTIASGALPTGLSLSSSGLISGTLGGSAGISTFSVNATDVNGRSTTSGSFTFTSVSPAWSALTITTTSTGESGPSSTSQVNMAATGSSATYSLSGGIISLTIPQTGTYRILAAGARGGDGATPTNTRGFGVYMQGDFSLTASEVLKIVIGQAGQDSDLSTANNGGGGGGGTFVTRSNNSILVIAGGGGGGDSDSGTSRGGNGQTGSSGQGSQESTVTFSGGSGGSGGGGAAPLAGGGGGGYSGNGTNGGIAFLNGANGSSANGRFGGFGGGGPGASGSGGAGGGGGGYSGGGAGQTGIGGGGGGGGGGSLNNGSNQSNGSTNNGPGFVTLTRL